ncbi:SusC/RagA family protein, partial [Bacillus pumilus]
SNMSITLQEGKEKSLNEVVVIGYGAVKKSDLTGSVTALKPDGKNKGLVVNAQEMISGKIAGVNVTTEGGAPGSKATIRIRGGASLNADSDPLIVIDGIPMDNNGVKGLSNALS